MTPEPDTILQADALELAASLPKHSVDLIVTDPPYYKMVDEPWDKAWDDAPAFLAWVGQLADSWRRILKPNGSLYVFAAPKMATRVEVEIAERFNVLNRLTWNKAGESGKDGIGRHRGAEKEALRAYFPVTEAIIFAEHWGADGYAAGASSWTAKCDELRGFLFEPLRAYLDGERRRAGVTPKECNQHLGNHMAGHYFTRIQWALPTEDNYLRLRELFNSRLAQPGALERDHDALATEYQALRVEYDALKLEYEALRRPFAVTAEDTYTDIWTFPAVASYPGKHPCEKPEAMIRHILTASSVEGAVVFDPFVGSGVVPAIARQLGRRFICGDLDRRWVAKARERVERPIQAGLL